MQEICNIMQNISKYKQVNQFRQNYVQLKKKIYNLKIFKSKLMYISEKVYSMEHTD